jgi:hypothetical protein
MTGLQRIFDILLNIENVARIVHVNGCDARYLGKSGHEHHVSGDDDHKVRTGRQRYVIHMQRPTMGAPGSFGSSDKEYCVCATQMGNKIHFVSGKITSGGYGDPGIQPTTGSHDVLEITDK